MGDTVNDVIDLSAEAAASESAAVTAQKAAESAQIAAETLTMQASQNAAETVSEVKNDISNLEDDSKWRGEKLMQLEMNQNSMTGTLELMGQELKSMGLALMELITSAKKSEASPSATPAMAMENPSNADVAARPVVEKPNDDPPKAKRHRFL